MKKLLIIDGSSLLTTSYYGNLPNSMKFAKTREEKALHYGEILQSKDGLYTNAIYGFLTTMFNLIKSAKPDYFAVCWDMGRNTFRRQEFAEYKANRKETEEPLKQQFKHMQQTLEFIEVKNFMSEDFEADDYAGTLGKMFQEDVQVIYFTKDEDYLQLVDGNKSIVWMPNKNPQDFYATFSMMVPNYLPKDVIEYNEDVLMKDKSLKPFQIIEFKGLSGDSADNIPGIPGIGPKTATALLNNFNTVDDIFNFIDGKDKKSIQKEFKAKEISRCPIEKLQSGKESAKMSVKLATIKRDIPLDVSIEELTYKLNLHALARILKRLDFNVEKFMSKIN